MMAMAQDQTLPRHQQEAVQHQQPGLAMTWMSCRSALTFSRAADCYSRMRVHESCAGLDGRSYTLCLVIHQSTEAPGPRAAMRLKAW